MLYIMYKIFMLMFAIIIQQQPQQAITAELIGLAVMLLYLSSGKKASRVSFNTKVN